MTHAASAVGEEHASEHDVRNAASAVGEEHASEHDKGSVTAECGTVPSVLPAEPTTVMAMCTAAGVQGIKEFNWGVVCHQSDDNVQEDS